MLFRIDDLLIIASNEEEAREIYAGSDAASELAAELPVEILIPEGQNCVKAVLDPMTTADSIYISCMKSIQDKYLSTLDAIEHVVQYLPILKDDYIHSIFRTLVHSKYNETAPLSTLIKTLQTDHPWVLSVEWMESVTQHASKYWIRRNHLNGEWTTNLELLRMVRAQRPTQRKETEELVEELHAASSHTAIQILLNSVNYSKETLQSYVQEHAHTLYGWVLEHYVFKQQCLDQAAFDGLLQIETTSS